MLVRITGVDRPGLTAEIMNILSAYDVHIQDIGQAVIHSTLSMGILIRVDEERSGRVMKELLFKTSELGVNIKFGPVTLDEYEAWVSRQGKNRYILTILGRRLEARQIGAVTHLIVKQGLNIDAIRRLSGRQSIVCPAEKTKACIEFSLRGTPQDREQMQADLLHLSGEMEIDCSFQLDNMYRRMRRLICSAMSSMTLTSSPFSKWHRRVKDSLKSISPRMADAVMAATSS